MISCTHTTRAELGVDEGIDVLLVTPTWGIAGADTGQDLTHDERGILGAKRLSHARGQPCTRERHAFESDVGGRWWQTQDAGARQAVLAARRRWHETDGAHVQATAQAQEPERRAEHQLVALAEHRVLGQHGRRSVRAASRIELGVAVRQQLDQQAAGREREALPRAAPRRQADAPGDVQPFCLAR